MEVSTELFSVIESLASVGKKDYLVQGKREYAVSKAGMRHKELLIVAERDAFYKLHMFTLSLLCVCWAVLLSLVIFFSLSFFFLFFKIIKMLR